MRTKYRYDNGYGSSFRSRITPPGVGNCVGFPVGFRDGVGVGLGVGAGVVCFSVRKRNKRVVPVRHTVCVLLELFVFVFRNRYGCDRWWWWWWQWQWLVHVVCNCKVKNASF